MSKKTIIEIFLHISILTIFCTSSIPMKAQIPHLFTTEEGLTTSSLRNVNVDSRGIVWISGARCLDTFDGFTFHSVSLFDKTIGQDICSVTNFVEDIGKGNYLVLTNTGTYLYNLASGEFRRVKLSDKENADYGYTSSFVLPYITPDKRIIITDGWGCYIYNTETLEVDVPASDKLQKSLEESYFHKAFVDSKGNMWADCHDMTLRCFSLRNLKDLPFRATPEAAAIVAGGAALCISEAGGNIYIGINDKLLMFSYKTNLLSVVPCNLNSPIDALLSNDDGGLLIGTDSKGLYELHPDGRINKFQTMRMPFSMEYGKVKCINRMSDGTLLLGLLQKGLMVIPPNSGDFTYHAVSPLHDEINASCITSICHGWIATDGCGMFRLQNPANGGYPELCNEGLNATLMQSVLIDKRGTAWVGSYGGGVQYFDGTRFVTPQWFEKLRNSPILALAYDKKEDAMYIGCNGVGLFKAELTNQKMTNISDHIVNNTWISTLYFDSLTSTLWAGTANGLFYQNTRTKEHGEFMFNNCHVLDINCVKADSSHVFIGTTLGLIVADKRLKNGNEPIYMFNDERVMSIEITKNYIWVSTSRSIIKIENKWSDNDKDTLPEYTVYKSFGGVYLGEFHKNSSMQVSHRILFGADNGIISFDPNQISKRQPLQGPIIFTSIAIGARPATISVSDQVELEPDESAFTITFCVPGCMASPNRIRYEYMLKGYDNTWRECKELPQAYYSGLHPGTYTLVVRAHDESDSENSIVTELTIKVQPHWYASVWAWIIYTLIFIWLIYYLMRAYSVRRRQQKIIHQARQNEQLKEARLNLFTSIAHELRSPLTMIVSPLRQLMSSDNDSDHQHLYNIMMRNSQRLLSVVKQITDIRHIDSGMLQLKFSEVDYVKYSSNIYETFAASAALKNITFTVENHNKPLNVWIDTVHFEKILTNLLSNAFKFTPEGGKVTATSSIADNNMELRFYNSGVELTDGEIERFFDRFYQASNAHNIQGSGIGLSLVQELTQLHHGTIEVHRVDTDGIEFVLRFPLGSNHLKAEDIRTEQDDDSETGKEEAYSYAELPEAIPAPQIEEGETGKKYTLLIVDDDKELCLYIANQLSERYNIVTAFSGNTAWQQILTSRPDVVITDIQMTDGDGMELCQRIKSNSETDSTPIIMLTGENGDDIKMQSLNLKVDHFLSKPFNLMMLQAAISQVLQVRENIMRRITRKDNAASDYSRVNITSADSKLFERINESIRQHLDDSEFGVEQMAAEVGISRVHLNRKMKEHYGISPNTFIKAYRLKQAAYLLVHTPNVNISEVAYTVGFSTAAYFSSSFRSYFGMTPKEFMAQYADNPEDETLKKLLE